MDYSGKLIPWIIPECAELFRTVEQAGLTGMHTFIHRGTM